jgi:hypothetical protein
MWRLYYPLRYFALVNNEKRHIDLWPTLVLALALTAPFVILPETGFFHANGFLDKLLTLTSALTGFYVAALVAAATFQHPDLDKTITAGPIALVRKGDDGQRVTELLTRREFACTIFGYLAFSTLALSLVAAFLVSISGANLGALATWPVLGALVAGPTFLLIRGVVIFTLCAMTAHMAVVTCLGLYYLMDRLYRRDRQIVTPKSSVSNSDAA